MIPLASIFFSDFRSAQPRHFSGRVPPPRVISELFPELSTFPTSLISNELRYQTRNE